MSPELMSFLGAFAGGAVAGLASSSAKWKKVEQRLEDIAHKAASRAVLEHADACQLRSVAAAHLAEEGAVQLTPSGRFPLPR